MDCSVAIKGSKEIRDFIYKLCNGLRRKEDICDYLLENHNEFVDEVQTRKTVDYHISKLKKEGFIHFKFDGRIIDLER